MSTLRVLFIGDVVGLTGRIMLQKHLDQIKKDYRVDAVIVNGENSAHGKGITPRIAKAFRASGVDIITTGNHIWQKKEIYPYLAQNKDVLRPANFPPSTPGIGSTTFMCKGFIIGIMNLQGRTFMKEHVDCPFRVAESLLTYLHTQTRIIFIDFHAEATSEKLGIAYFLEGRITGLVGTHTHVQTADERVLPKGTAYISDLGMVGSLNSMLGMKKESIINHFLTQMPSKFEVETQAPVVLCGALIEADAITGKAISIERIQIIDNNIVIDTEHDD